MPFPSGNPLQCSCLENPRDGGAWWAAVYGVAQSWTQLKRLSSSSSSSSANKNLNLLCISQSFKDIQVHRPQQRTVTSPIVFHCFTQGNFEEFLTHLVQKNIERLSLCLSIISLLQDPSPRVLPNMPHFHHFTQPLGGCKFTFILIDFLYRIMQCDFYSSFYRTLRKDDQVSRQVPKPESGRGKGRL